MSKVLYISFVDYANKFELGVVKKIEGQIKAFRSQGMDVLQLKLVNRSLFIGGEHLLDINGKVDFFIKLPIILFRYFTRNPEAFKMIYIRKTYLTPLHYCWFKTLARRTKHIFLEIPTYPYEGEMKDNKLALLFDNVTNYLIRPRLSGIITSQSFDEIWGMKTIKIRNGYDFSQVKEWPRKKEVNKIRFITVTNLLFFHGLDRLIRAMYQYKEAHGNNGVKLEFHIVGAGEERQRLEALQQELGVEGVFFHGPKTGQELEIHYVNADIGVGSLGLYRKNVTFTSTLKTIEYCYYGLPFITGSCDRELSNDRFVMEVGNNDSPIDLAKVIAWYSNLTIEQKDIQARGKELYSWDDQIKKITETMR